MAENVKIIIQEDNQTKARGVIASSDIAYVPGLMGMDKSGDAYIPHALRKDGSEVVKNIPIYCETIAEFEDYFGKYPYQLTNTDKSGFDDFTNVSVDPSYVYAKELIFAGIPVYYDAIEAESIEDISEVYATAKQAYDAAVETFNTDKVAYENAVKAHDIAYAEYCDASDELTKAQAALENNTDETKTSELEAAVAAATTVKETKASAHSEATVALHTTYDEYITAKCALEEAEVDLTNAALNTSNKISYLYEKLNDHFNMLTDKGEYNVKYITSGGYPVVRKSGGSLNFSTAGTMLTVAESRQDAVALIDHYYDTTLPTDPASTQSIYNQVANYSFGNSGAFGAMFTPWAIYSCSTLTDDVATTDVNEAAMYMPASFGYLLCMAQAIKTSPNWLAMAGVTRGLVPKLIEIPIKCKITNRNAETYQPKTGGVSINAITEIKPYGNCIWGNRTLMQVPASGTTALNFLNTRNMISDIKKLAYTTAKELMFEQDSDTLWTTFVSRVSPLLNRLKGGFGISDYKLIKGTTKYNGDPLTRGEVSVVIRIVPIYAVEYFEITVTITDDDVTVS